MPPRDGKTPPLGSPAQAMFHELKEDFRDFRETDRQEHAALNNKIDTVVSLNRNQSTSLARIEGRLAVTKRVETETGKTKRQTIKTIGTLLAAFITGILAHYLGS